MCFVKFSFPPIIIYQVDNSSAFEKFSPILKFSYDIKDKKTFFVYISE